ncbi:MAG: cation transporting ATPase C-terminal domain-containing protein, partial [Hymenobacteraceae bacterium]|nr:cation transporting ATPase C-terminal domain-containing protein [Hymenobacteraceae bacterium]MDX5480164.1 cation transporting ATPase C-terminal domain-containing protein [Hymenobacteraceae bacterium]
AVIAAQGVHLLSMHIPFMQNVLQVEPISLQEWGIMMVLALAILAIMELFKWEHRMRPSNRLLGKKKVG